MASLEMGHALERRGAELVVDEPLPVPNDVRLLVADRLDRLSDGAVTCWWSVRRWRCRRCTRLRLPCGPGGASQPLTEVVEMGMMEVNEGSRLRFTHPLVVSVAYGELDAADRRRCTGGWPR